MAEAVMTVGGRSLPQPSLQAVAAGALTIVAALFGGASLNARTPLIIVELVSLPVGALALRRLAEPGRWRGAIWPLVLIAGLFAIPLIQSIRLPPEIWLRAAGQEPRFTALVLSGAKLGWAPLSLYPAATLAAIPALFPPAVMALITLGLDRGERRWIAAIWIVAALAGVFLGLAQLGQPDGGWAYPYSSTNPGSLVGWFANRNHEAAMLLALIPIAATLATGRDAARWIGGAFLVIGLVAIGVVRSRAGILLTAPMLILTAAMLARQHGLARRKWIVAGFAAISLISIGAVAVFALTPILSRFGADSLPEFRYRAWPLIWSESLRHLPFGSGVGSFDRVFRAIEPVELVAPAYFNHAHNDYLEVWLETGLMGAAALVAVVAWFLPATWRAWSREGSSLGRAASLGVLTLAAMSWTDYPLRTEALAVLFAFLLAAITPSADARSR